MSNTDRFVSGIVPAGLASAAVTMFWNHLDAGSFPWLGLGASVVSILMAVNYGVKANGFSLLGLAIGGWILCATYGTMALQHESMAMDFASNYTMAFLASIVGFPLGVLVLVSMSDGEPSLLSVAVNGIISLLYLPLGFVVFSFLGLPDWLLDPFNPWFQFGSNLHLAAQASLALNLIGMCMAGGIGLLVLGLPLFLTIGVVAAVRKQ